MMSQEDRIKLQLYQQFRKKYFAGEEDDKKALRKLSHKESLEYHRQQKNYVEQEYQKIKYSNK